MNKKLFLVGGLGLVAAVVFPACSSSNSSGDGSSGTFSTGLPPSESLGSLSDADAQKLCDAFKSFSSSASTQGSACKFAGIAQAAIAQFSGATSDADLQKACSDAETACKNRPAPKVDGGVTTTTTCTKPPATCTATVGELETCENDASAALNKAFASIPECSALTAGFFKQDGGGLGLGTGSTNPPSCQTVQQKCPGVVGMSSTTPPTP